LTLHDVVITEMGDHSLVEWEFTLDWTFDESAIPEYAMPGIVVYDDDDLNPVALMTNLGEIRWQLDNNLAVVVANMADKTPPLSSDSADHIYVQPGDDLTFSGIVIYNKSGLQLMSLPEQGLEVNVATTYGTESLVSYAEVAADGSWTTGMILPQRSLVDNILTVGYSITGVPSPGEDVSGLETQITVDEVAPVVEFSDVPIELNNEELESQPFTILIFDEGGMPEGDLQVNWAFLRNSVILESGQSNGFIPLMSNNAESWSYAGSIDFTDGVNVSLEDGDELIWWLDITDKAGNSASGTGLSSIDARNTFFTVLSFDVTVMNIEIALADGTTPRGNEIVAGTEIGVIVNVRNLGTKAGTVTIELMEDMGEGRSWLSHGSVELSLPIGQNLKTEPLYFETYSAGSQDLYINITGMDMWIDNSALPHCFGTNETASCDLSVEADMPMVISQDDVESGMGGMTVVISILVVLLGGAGLAIAILLRRDNPDDSIFYDDDDWDEMENTYTEEKATPILPPMAPDRPNMDAATKALDTNFGDEADISEEEPAETMDSIPAEVEVTPVDDEVPAEEQVAEEEEVVEEEEPEESKTDLMKLKKNELVARAKSAGVLSSGTKSEIIERLLR
jgi:hypothetical protein